MTPDFNDLYFSEVATKLELGRRLYQEHYTILNSDPYIKQELVRLTAFIADLEKQMASMAMFSLCTECGQKEGGGCCSDFMAGETDGIQILINLLLGINVNFQRDDGLECVYLGRNGCIFKAKPMFCLNYNCGAVYDSNPQIRMLELDKTAGAVLSQQYKLEELLLRRLTIG